MEHVQQINVTNYLFELATHDNIQKSVQFWIFFFLTWLSHKKKMVFIWHEKK